MPVMDCDAFLSMNTGSKKPNLSAANINLYRQIGLF